MDLNQIPIYSDSTRCVGCTDCVKRCPTEAIRVRNRKASIIQDRCIACGECIHVCKHHANMAAVDPLDVLERFSYKVALVDPVLYSEYSGLRDRNVALTALKSIGFDDVFECAEAADVISRRTMRAILDDQLPKPVISSSCPTVRRLILARFPSLLENLLPYNSPMELGARIARYRAVKKTGLKPEEIGIVYLSPCPARATEARSPLCADEIHVDAVVSIADLYTRLYNAIKKVKDPEVLATATQGGVSWAVPGGEGQQASPDAYMAADGMENIIRVLEAIEDGLLKSVDFFELSACTGGCVGGPLTVENAFIAKARMTNIARHNIHLATPATAIPDEMIAWDHPIPYEPSIRLTGNIVNAMAKLKKIQDQEKRFPGMDCGACGAPSCHALAEDIAEGRANEDQCIFLLRGKMQRLLNSHQISLEAEKRNSDDD